MYLLSQLPLEVLKQSLNSGLLLLALGMGTVFLFLTLLVFVTKLVSKIVAPKSNKVQAISVNKVETPTKKETTLVEKKQVVKSQGGTITAPMPGLILKLNVKVGDTVQANQCVMVMEAMKMENEIFSPYSGTVESISVTLAQQVDPGAILMKIAGNSTESAPVSSCAKVDVPPVTVVQSAPAVKPLTNIPTRRPSTNAPIRRTTTTPIRRTSQPRISTTIATPVKAKVEENVSKSSSSITVTVPMPGTVLKLNVKEGDTVKQNDIVLVMEAMKMENEIFAPKAGTITKLYVSAGSQVEPGQNMYEIS